MPWRRSASLPPGRLPGSQGDDVTRRGRRRRYGDAATHAPAVAAGPASRATMRKCAPSPRQRGPHARPEARAGLEGQRGAKKSGGGMESPQGSPGELGERAGEGRAPLRGWRLAAGSGAVGWQIRGELQRHAGMWAERGDTGRGRRGSGQRTESRAGRDVRRQGGREEGGGKQWEGRCRKYPNNSLGRFL